MDSKGNLGMRNWEFSDHTGRADNQAAYLKMSAYTDRDAGIGESNSEATSMNFSWVPHRNFLTSTKNVTHLSEMIDTPSMLPAEENTLRDGDHEAKPTKVRKQPHPSKRTNRVATKALRPKETKKNPSSPTKKKGGSASTRKHEKKNQDDDVERATIEFSGVPVPVCSCTGAPHQCYRWGAGGWQSSCCTTSISEYPLPMSSSRPSARLAGRKMSIGAYGKLLQRLAAEGQDLSYAVDLKEHWARHGTNKFVTIR